MSTLMKTARYYAGDVILNKKELKRFSVKYYKGKQCHYKDSVLICQEGFCDRCAIYLDMQTKPTPQDANIAIKKTLVDIKYYLRGTSK